MLPEKGANRITNHHVENCSGLLSMDPIHIQYTGMVQRMADGSFCDFMKDNTRCGKRETEKKTDRICNHFTFSVIICCEIDSGSLRGCVFQLLDGFRLFFQPMIFRIRSGRPSCTESNGFERLFQGTEMPHRRTDCPVGTKKGADFLTFGG